MNKAQIKEVARRLGLDEHSALEAQLSGCAHILAAGYVSRCWTQADAAERYFTPYVKTIAAMFDDSGELEELMRRLLRSVICDVVNTIVGVGDNDQNPPVLPEDIVADDESMGFMLFECDADIRPGRPLLGVTEMLQGPPTPKKWLRGNKRNRIEK